MSFHLPKVKGNPFAAEVWGLIDRPGGGSTVRVAAFHDGGDVWRVRYTPDRVGAHRVRITIGPAGRDAPAVPVALAPETFTVAGAPRGGFVRRSSRCAQRFALDDGTGYFPVGCNVPWADFEEYHRKFKVAGLNWSRHWMACFARLQLDWRDAKGIRQERLSLDNARKWDRIVSSAEASGVRFQMVLQHHGQYSSTQNSNWRRCPWNVANGGFLAKGQEFFTSARARRLTRMKYRYVVARWGHSTSIMAWELFNEVQLTDAGLTARLNLRKSDRNWSAPQAKAIVTWHVEMAGYLRSLDPYRHLVTTSSDFGPESPMAAIVDFYQPHVYRTDTIAAVCRFSREIARYDKPIFCGEAGGKSNGKQARDAVRGMLWASLMSGGAGAAQKWSQQEFLPALGDYRAAVRFLAAAGFAGRHFAPAPVRCRSRGRSGLTFVPEGGFAAKELAAEVPTDGRPVEGLARMPAYLHGDRQKRRNGSAGEQSLRIDAPQELELTVLVEEVSAAGGTVAIQIDGRQVAARTFGPTSRPASPRVGLTAVVPAGAHVIRVLSTGKDWFKVGRYSLAGGAPALSALCCSAGDAACLWVYNRDGITSRNPASVEGELSIGGMKAGAYAVQWWDTQKGLPFRTETVRTEPSGALRLKTPPVARDVAVHVKRQ